MSSDIDEKKNDEIKHQIFQKMKNLSLDGNINNDIISYSMNNYTDEQDNNDTDDIDENSFTSSLVKSKPNEKIKKIKKNITKTKRKKNYIKYPRTITIEYENMYKKDDDIQQVGDNFSDDNYIVARYEKKWFKIKISS